MKALIAMLLGISFLLTDCKTSEGIGRDLESGGKKIEREATEHR
jgi:predicted small secreted protein